MGMSRRPDLRSAVLAVLLAAEGLRRDVRGVLRATRRPGLQVRSQQPRTAPHRRHRERRLQGLERPREEAPRSGHAGTMRQRAAARGTADNRKRIDRQRHLGLAPRRRACHNRLNGRMGGRSDKKMAGRSVGGMADRLNEKMVDRSSREMADRLDKKMTHRLDK